MITHNVEVLPRGAGGARGIRRQQENTHEAPQGKKGVLCYEGNKADSSDEMPLYKRTWHGKQTGGVGSSHAAGKLRPDCHHGNLVG